MKFAEKAIKTEETPEIAFLDERLLNTPSIALSECNRITTEMSYVAKETMVEAIESLFSCLLYTSSVYKRQKKGHLLYLQPIFK